MAPPSPSTTRHSPILRPSAHPGPRSEVYRGAVEFRRAEVLSMERLERMRGPEKREEAMAIMGKSPSHRILEGRYGSMAVIYRS